MIPQSSHSGLINTRLNNRYLVKTELGRGGFAVVYLATDEQLAHRRVVVKVLLETVVDEWTRRRFRTEVEALARLSHPDIVSISDSGDTEDGRPFLVMEYVQGTVLRHFIRPEGMEFGSIAELVRQVGGALEEAHRSGVWHRDLKPENIIVQTLGHGERRAKVIDFGVARVMSSELLGDRTSGIAGTIRYMAPEQLRGKPSASSDIYALALITYEMVAGRTPFPATTLLELNDMQSKGVQIPPRKLRSALPEAAERCILRSLSCREQERHSSVAEFVRDLISALPATTLNPGIEATIAAELPQRWLRRTRARVTVLVVTLLAAAAALLAVSSPTLRTSVVVFQIRDVTGDPTHEELSRGLTDELVSRLIRVQGLTVRQYYSTRDGASTAVVSERFYLDGDLQRYEKQIRLTMRLTDTRKNGVVVWSRSYDHNLENPLELETEVADQVVSGLQESVFSDNPNSYGVQIASYRTIQLLESLLHLRRMPEAATQSPAAYEEYLRGRVLFEERTPAAVQSAIESLHRAISIDPNFALAYAALSDCYRAAIENRRMPQEEAMRRSVEYAERAVQLNPRLPEAYAALAGVQQAQWKWKASEQSYREAIRLDPKSPIAYRRYGGLILQFGRFDEALGYVQKGLELDPYDYPSHSAYGLCLMIARRYQDAEDHLKWTLAQRNLLSAHDILALVYALRGREAAKDEARRYFDLSLEEIRTVHDLETRGAPNPETASTPMSESLYAIVYAIKGDDQAACRRILRRMISEPSVSPVSAVDLAEIYGLLGENAKAIDYLRQAAAVKDRGLLYLKVDPFWDPIRNDPGFQEVLLTMHL